MKSKMSARAVARSGQKRVPISSLSTAQKLSAAALSKQLPVRPILCRCPNLLILSRSCPEVYSDPRSLRITQLGSRRPSRAAMSRASTTSSARWWSAIEYPMISRVARSSHGAR